MLIDHTTDARPASNVRPQTSPEPTTVSLSAISRLRGEATAATSETDLLRQTLDLVLGREPNLAQRFSDTLFTHCPGAPELFGRDQSQDGGRLLAEALLEVVGHVDDVAWLQHNLTEMGARHAANGVKPETYQALGETLLGTLRDVAGSDWTARHESVWQEAYDGIAEMMLAGHTVHA